MHNKSLDARPKCKDEVRRMKDGAADDWRSSFIIHPSALLFDAAASTQPFDVFFLIALVYLHRRETEFEWDPVKAASNLQKHEVSFAEAATVFFDPLSLTVPEATYSIGERVSSLLVCLISNVISLLSILTAVLEYE